MTGRIFITGDKHGSLVPFFGLAQRNELTPADILLIAGDAGYVWREHDSSPLTTLQQLFPGTVAFVDGNHENHALLNSMEVQLWNGGRVHRVDERVYHLMRGELYSIDGTTIFTFGGADPWMWTAQKPAPAGGKRRVPTGGRRKSQAPKKLRTDSVSLCRILTVSTM